MVQPSSSQAIIRMLERASAGDQKAISQLIPIVYDELRKLARGYLARENQPQTLQATALVHEVYLRLLRGQNPRWTNRAHFFGIAARSMRQILVERARARKAQKRGSAQRAITLSDEGLASPGHSLDVLALDEALNALATLDPKQARIVELRFFGGLTVEETAVIMETSPATVKRWWDLSKAWLRRELSS